MSSVRSLGLAELLRVCAWASAAGTLTARLTLPEPIPSRLVLLLAAFIGQFALLATGRSVYDDWLKQHRARGENCRRVVLIGYDHVLASCAAPCRTPRPASASSAFSPSWTRPTSATGRRASAGTPTPRTGSPPAARPAIVGSTALASSEAEAVVRELLASQVHVHVSPGLDGIDYRRLRALPLRGFRRRAGRADGEPQRISGASTRLRR